MKKYLLVFILFIAFSIIYLFYQLQLNEHNVLIDKKYFVSIEDKKFSLKVFFNFML